MSADENTRLARRFHGEIFAEDKLQDADEVLSADFRWRNPVLPRDVSGPEG